MPENSPRKPTVRDIASRVGVSPATVSAALRPSGDGSSIGAETRERVIQAANELGYDFSRLRIQPTRPRTVAMLMPDGPTVNASFRYQTLLYISERLSQHGFRMLFDRIPREREDRQPTRDLLQRRQADAAIATGFAEEWPAGMAEWEVPCVYIGATVENLPICTVNVDDEMGGRAVGEHLWSLGHRDIGVVHLAPSEWGTRRERGVRSVWQRSGCDIPHERIAHLTELTAQAVDAAVANLMTDRGDGPATAIFCDTDWSAALALRSVRQMGLRVPEDVSIIGFDDADCAAVLDPPLTTVRQPIRELSALAIELILEQLNAERPTVRSYRLPCELIVRHTTAPVLSRTVSLSP